MRLYQYLIAIVVGLTCGNTFAQTTYYYDGSGQLTQTGNWWTNTNGTGSNPSNFTANNQIFQIRNTTSVTLNNNWTVSGTGSRVDLGDATVAAITLNHTGGTFNATLNINAASSGGNTYNSATGSVATLGTLNSSSTVIYSNAGAQNVQGVTYGNLTLSGSGTKTAINAISVSGILTINTGITLDMSTFALSSATTIAGTGTLQTSNTTTIPIPVNKTWTCAVTYASASAQTIVAGTYSGTLTASGGNRTLSSTGTINISGTFTPGTGTYTSTGSTVVFNGAAQNVPLTTSYNNLTIAGSGIKTATGNITVNGVLTINSGLIFSMSTFTLAGTPTSVSGTGTLQTASTAATPIPTSITWPCSVDYNGATQNLSGGTYTNLTASGTGNKTAIGNVSVSGTLTINAGRTLNMNTFTLSGTLATLSGTGTLQTASTAAAPIPANKTWPYPVTYSSASSQTIVGGTYSNTLTTSGGARVLDNTNTINIAGTFTPGTGTYTSTGSTITFTGAAQNVPTITSYNNLAIAGSGTKTATGNIVVNGALTINSALTFTMSTFTLSGSLTSVNGTGTLQTASTAGTPIPASKTWTCTVDFNGAGQNIVAGTYSNLTVSGTGNKTATGNLAVSGTLNINASRTLDMSTFTLSGALTTLSGSGTLQTANTSSTPIPVNKTWPYPVTYSSASSQTIVGGTYNGTLTASAGARILDNTNTINIAGTFTPGTNAYTSTGSTVAFTGAAQNVPTITSYNNLTIAGSGTKTATGNITVNGILTINSTLTFTMSTFTLAGSLTSVSGTGTLQTASTATTPIPASKTWTFTVDYAGAGQTLSGGTYTNLTASGTGNKTASGNVSVSGTLTINTGRTLDMSTFALSGTLTTLSGTGTLQTANTSSTPIPVNKTWPYAVTYSSASAQTIVGGTYNGTLTASAGARILDNTNTINIAGTFTPGANTYTSTGSTVAFTGAAQTVPAITAYNNLTIAGTGDKTAGAGLVVNGTLTINSGRILALNANTLTGTLASTSGTGTLTTSGSAPLASGKTWTFTVQYLSTGAQTIIPGNYTNLVSSSTGTRTLSNAATISISGTFTPGTNAYTVTGSTVSFNGAAQNIPTFTFNNLTIAGSSTKTATGNITVNGILTINSGLVLNMGTNTLSGIASTSGTGSLQTQSTAATPIPSGDTWTFGVTYNSASAQNVMAGTYTDLNTSGGNRTLPNGGTVNISGTFTAGSGTFTVTGSTVNFNGAVQTVAGITYNNLTLAGTGDKTASGNIGVNGALTINAGRLLDMGTNNLTNVGSVAGTGTLQTQSTSATPLPANITWPYTIVYNSASAQTIVGGTYGTLTASGGNRSFATGATINISGAFTAGSGTYTPSTSTVNFNGTGAQTIPSIAYNNLTLSGARTTNNVTLAASGTIFIAGTFTTSATFSTGAYITTGSTINFNGTTQNIPAFTFNNLSISNSGNKTMTGNVTVGALLDIAAGTLTIGSGNTLTLNGTINSSAGTLTAGSCGGGLPNLTVGGSGALGTINLTAGGRTFNNVSLNRTSGSVNFGTPVNFGGTLTLTNGAIVTNDRIAFHTSNTPISRTNGTLTLGTTSVLIFGNCDQAGTAFTLPNNLFTTPPVINELWVDRTSGITLGNQMIRVSNVLTLTNNATLNTNNNLTLVSDNSGTARVASLSGSSSVTGQVVTERFIPATARRWRFMSCPISNTTLEDWRSEMFVTGAGSGNAVGSLNSNGFDATPNNSPSIYFYNEAASGNSSIGWVAQSNNTSSLTNVPLVVGRGYRVFVRGDRSSLARLNETDLTQNAVTLNLIGTINQGNIVMPVTYTTTLDSDNDGWNLVGNPYPSPYDWNAYWDAGNAGGDDGTNYTNINQTISIYDATTNSYKSYNAAANTGTFNGIIAQGQAFFVKSTASGTAMTFVEAFKVNTVPTQMFKTSTGGNDELSIKLIADSINIDQLVVKFINQATRNIDAYDIDKRVNPLANIGSKLDNGRLLTLDSRPLINDDDTVTVAVGTSAGTYKLRFEAIPANGKFYYLKDNFLNSLISIYNGMEVPYTINTNPGSSANNRFQVIITTNSALPVSFAMLEADRVERGNKIKWTTFNEINVSHFEVMASPDNKNFLPVTTVQAIGQANITSKYEIIDATPYNNVGIYYQVRIVDKDGQSSTTNTVYVSANDALQVKAICYPNPADAQVTVKHPALTNLTELPTLTLLNTFGKTMPTPLYTLKDAQLIINTSDIPSGYYYLNINTGSQSINTTILVYHP